MEICAQQQEQLFRPDTFHLLPDIQHRTAVEFPPDVKIKEVRKVQFRMTAQFRPDVQFRRITNFFGDPLTNSFEFRPETVFRSVEMAQFIPELECRPDTEFCLIMSKADEKQEEASEAFFLFSCLSENPQLKDMGSDDDKTMIKA